MVILLGVAQTEASNDQFNCQQTELEEVLFLSHVLEAGRVDVLAEDSSCWGSPVHQQDILGEVVVRKNLDLLGDQYLRRVKVLGSIVKGDRVAAMSPAALNS